MTGRRWFGTDGIRGRVGDSPISADFMLNLGRAAGVVLSSDHKGPVLIGKDTRISGYLFESVLEAGLVSAGVDVRLLGPMPTPAVAWLTREMRGCAGIVISASHNPYYDNGIKFFNQAGEKLADGVEMAIEDELDQAFATVAPDRLGRAERVPDAESRYTEFCCATFPEELSLKGLTLVLDCANGATYHVAPQILSQLGADVIPMGVSPDGLNINVDCGSTHPEALMRQVVRQGADAGVAFDGDGDRVVMVDRHGRVLDGDDLLYIIATARKRAGTLSGGVVGTVMTNLGLERALGDLGIEFQRARVGDRFVHQMLNEHGWVLGGEASGHLLCLDVMPTGDAIINALGVLAVMAAERCGLDELVSGMRRFPQVTVNVPVSDASELETHPRVMDARRATEKALGDRGRLILRPSGTEPLVRVTIEGEDEAEVRQLAESLAATVAEALGANGGL